jgi:phosphatidylethanolamine/phosphatidyl-N-methylethanolamine N-methyltransferase
MGHSYIESLALFGRELIKNPGPIGAAIPSSPALARGMARMVEGADSGYVVELGAGTGAITKGLVEGGISPERLLAVEYSPDMAKLLRRRFPKIRVLQGDACNLNHLLRQTFGAEIPPIAAVVSSLPLRSLPQRKVARLFLEVRRLLTHSGHFVQFTYAVHRTTRFPQCFQLIGSSIVWANFPPARVESYAVR